MKTKREIYYSILSLLRWLEGLGQFSNIHEFAKGMELSPKGLSADPGVWEDWDKMVPEMVPEENAFGYLKDFFNLYIKKYEMWVFESILYLFDEKDMDFNPEALKKSLSPF